MTYNQENKTIDISNDEFEVDSGVMTIHVLRDLAARPDAPQSFKDDWESICNWLGGFGEESHNIQLSNAWKKYYTIKSSPSTALINSFKASRQKGIQRGWNFLPEVPDRIFDIFDRMLASDEEIAKNRFRGNDNSTKNQRSLSYQQMTNQSINKLVRKKCSVDAVKVVAYCFGFLGFLMQGGAVIGLPIYVVFFGGSAWWMCAFFPLGFTGMIPLGIMSSMLKGPEGKSG